MANEVNEVLEPDVLEVETRVVEESLALDATTRAEIDSAITTARRYPRSLATFVNDVTSMATVDRQTAEEMFYSLRRTGKTIQGPSVRLAEVALSAWGNVRAGARILGESEDGRFIRGVGVCHDLQRNVYVAMEVQRRITTKDGAKYGDDMVGVTGNAAAAIAFRNAVFKVIPRGMYRSAYERAKQVATGDAKTLTERREEVFDRLKKMNPLITEARILASVERPSLADVTLDDVTHLIGLGTAIRDGAQSVDEAFPEPPTIKAEDVVGAGAGKAKTAAPATGEPNDKPAAAETLPEKLTSRKVAELKALAEKANVSWQTSVEDALGGPVEKLEGDPAQLEADIVGLIRSAAGKSD